MAGKSSIPRTLGKPAVIFSQIRRQKFAFVLTLLVALFIAPVANADAIYTFYDFHNNITLQFTTPYIATPSTLPVPVSTFTVAPSGFVPCTLQIFNGSTPGNTLGCTATAIIAGVPKTWEEIWVVMNNAAFPTTTGSFVIPFGDIQWGFSGDIPLDAGNISVTTVPTPEPVSMMLLLSGAAALGLGNIRNRFVGKRSS